MSKRINTNQLDPISEPTKKPKFQSIDTDNKNVHTTTTATTASVGHTHTHGRNIPMERALVVHSVTEVTKRLSQVDSTPERSATSAKHKSRNTVGPWKLGKTLGKGSSGKVRLAKNMETGQLAAIKIVPKKKNQNQDQNQQSQRGRSHVSVALSDISHSIASTATSTEVHKAENKGELSTNLYGIEREIVIMKLVSHPNIMGLYEVWENKTDLFLVLEYVDGGELFDYLVAKGRLSEEEAVHYFRQIIEGVAFCHSFNICHRDLKPENLLLDKRNKLIKIADFGMAALELPDKLLETSCGSPHYASPEIVMGKPYHGGPSDIWSCGIILYALLSGHLPFNDNNIRHLLMKVQSGKYQMPPNLSPEARDLIERILVVNPEERITISEILAHPLLTKYEEQSQSGDSSSNSTINPLEYISGAFSSIDLHLNSREDIDSSILSNLRILWHGAPREVLISKLLQRDMCEEKLFYFLLLQYKQKDFNSAVRESEDANARLQGPQRQPDTQLPSPSTYTGLSTTIESSETSDTLTTHRSVSDVAPSSSEVSVDSTADDTITSKEKLEVMGTSEGSAEKYDPNAPILTQKSQFSISSLLKAHGIAVSSSLSIRSQLTLPPRQRQFVASSSRTLKRTTSFKAVDTSKSQRLQIPENDISIPNSSSSSSSSFGRSPSGSSTDKMPLKMPVSRDSPEVVEDQFPRAEMPSDIDTKKSLYSLQSISKKSLNLNNFLSSSSTIPDTRITSFTPPVEQRREFEMVCDQLLFGNTLDNILEEDEDSLTEPEMFNSDQSKQVALEQIPVGTRPPQLNKTEFSRLYHPHSSQKSGFVPTHQTHLRKPGYPDIVASTAITSDPIGGVYSPSVDRRLAEMEDAVDPSREENASPGPSEITLKVCTNPPLKTSNPKNSHHPPSSPLPVFSSAGTVTQQGIQLPEDTYAHPKKAYPAAISQRGSYRPGPIADSATEYLHAVDTNRFSSGTQQQSVPTRNRTLRMSSAPIANAVHVPFSLDPRRNVTEPSKLETLLRIVGKNTNPRNSKKTPYGYSSDDDDDEDDNDESEWNYTKGSIFNALDQTLKHFKEGLQVSYSQSKAFLAASDATTGIDDHSMTGALAQSSDIQDTVVSRQPSMLSQATSFANLNRFVTAQEEETQTDAESPVSPRRHESPQQSVSGNISFKRSPNQRKSLASFLGSKPRSSLIGSKTSSDMNLALFSDLTYVLDIPTKMSTAEMVELPHAGHRKQVASTTSEVLLDKVLENENESQNENESAQATGEQNQAGYAGDVGDTNSFTSVSDRPSVMSTTDGVNIFEDAQSDTSSDLTDSDSNVRSHLQRKAISIDTLNTTNVIAPTTNVRISIYANDTNTDSNTPEKALPRETTEELIARFKLPENPMNRFQQKRFSKVDGNRLSEVLHSSESTSSKFEDLQEEGEQGAVRISKIDVSASKHPLNNLQRTKIIEGQLRRVTKMLEDESSPDSVGNLVDLIDKMTLKEKSLVDPSSGDSKARKSAVELPTTNSSVTISKSPEIPQERALPPTPSPESHLLPEVEDVPAPEESNTGEYDGEQSIALEDQPPSAAGSLSSNMGDEPKDSEKDNGKEVDSPVDANFEVLTSVPKQPWYIKLFESFRANSKRHSEEYVAKIPFDDLHLLVLNAFGKNNVDYRLKNLDRRLGKEKVEYSCRFVGGNSKFKLKISCRDSNSIVTIKRKGKLDKTTDGTFVKFRRDVEQSIKGLESK